MASEVIFILDITMAVINCFSLLQSKSAITAANNSQMEIGNSTHTLMLQEEIENIFIHFKRIHCVKPIHN